MKESLSELIKAARKESGLTLDVMAQKVGAEPQWLSSIENERGIPKVALLIRIHEELVSADESSPAKELGVWLLKWTEARLKREFEKPTEGKNGDDAANKEERKRLGQKGLEAVQKFYSQSVRAKVHRRRTNALPTLADFPEAFEELVVVCGDRRESPPKTKADLFADSLSSADLTHIPKLFQRCGRQLDIRSDKGFLLGDNDYLTREFGERHIIVLGSPAVNLLARMINENCIFRFAIQQPARDFSIFLEKEIPETNDPNLLEVFWKMATQWREGGGINIDVDAYYEPFKRKDSKIQVEQINALADKVKGLLNDHTAKRIKNLFHTPGFSDPADGQQHGDSPRQDNDFGVVSLCPNPYSKSGKHMCILVAGIHAPGTDQALRVLATDDFRERPLGGVIEAKINLQAGWIERLYKASFDWQTKPYEVKDVLNNFTESNLPVFKTYTPAEIDSLSKFVRQFLTATDTPSREPRAQRSTASTG